jgi:hypothetical protein
LLGRWEASSNELIGISIRIYPVEDSLPHLPALLAANEHSLNLLIVPLIM